MKDFSDDIEQLQQKCNWLEHELTETRLECDDLRGQLDSFETKLAQVKHEAVKAARNVNKQNVDPYPMFHQANDWERGETFVPQQLNMPKKGEGTD